MTYEIQQSARADLVGNGNYAIVNAAAECYAPIAKAAQNPYVQAAATIGMLALTRGRSAGSAIEEITIASETNAFRVVGAGSKGISPATAALVRTKDIDRTLIQMEGYGADSATASNMESIIASARDGVWNGSLKSAEKLEEFIHDQYFQKIRSVGSPIAGQARDYTVTGLGAKNFPYRERLEEILGESGGEHVAETVIGDKKIQFIRTYQEPGFQGIIRGPRLQLPNDPEVFEAAKLRKNELFSELTASAATRSPTMLDNNLKRVGEMEWLNAQTWKWNRGSAGVSQLEARTWLEVVGVDSGRFARGTDPNLEALSRPLSNFKDTYKSLFERPPQFFVSS